MSRYHSYINTAKIIINQYKGEKPLAIFLKQFFAKEKKYGSKDRKQINSLCYQYYRVSRAIKNASREEELLIAAFLCERYFSNILAEIRPKWNELITSTFERKKEILENHFDSSQLFPFTNELSFGIDIEEFTMSFLYQPKFFIRLRPGYEKVIPTKLRAASIPFEHINNYCLSLPNSTKIEDVITIDKEAVIQDYNSQQVGEIIKSLPIIYESAVTIWDCCAASGGKSIMVFDINNKIKLTVSDIRQSILHNLHSRFKRAGIQHYQRFTADLTENNISINIKTKFNIIIADVPCTGSGTWARTPEQLHFFKKEMIEIYSTRQKRIITSIIHHINKNGYLIYITCSVFKQENEEIIMFTQEKYGLQLTQMKLLKGYNMQADTMFVAIMKKN